MLSRMFQSCKTRQSIYQSISPILFDVSLRDGIQNDDPCQWNIERKTAVLENIVSTHKPASIEIGSLVSPKLLPIMKDSLEMATIAEKVAHGKDVYMLIPSLAQLHIAIEHNIRRFSFITSVSDKFQQRNTRKSVHEKRAELKQMESIIAPLGDDTKTKLYISCITECPIMGPLDIHFVLHELLVYHYDFGFDELCLSDTCGSLQYDDFQYLVDGLFHFGVPMSKISLHLHCSPANATEIRRILWYAFDKNIRRFDVSTLETGGCSVSLSPDKRHPNLSYEVFHDCLDRYIEYHLS